MKNLDVLECLLVIATFVAIWAATYPGIMPVAYLRLICVAVAVALVCVIVIRRKGVLGGGE